MFSKSRSTLAIALLAMAAGSLMTLAVIVSLPQLAAWKQAAYAASAQAAPDLTDQDLKKIATVYELIQKQYIAEVDRDKMISGAINGMLGALEDPYSYYMNAEEAEQFDQSLSSTIYGIGVEVALQNGRVTVLAPIKGTPADKAGILPGDVILAVDGEVLDGLSLNQAVQKIRGPKGSEVKLAILRGGSGEPVELTVVRDVIPVETVYGEMVTDRIGKIEIRQFSTQTAVRFQEELARLREKGMEALLIDVRNNPGGYLPVVVEIAEQFLEEGRPILQMQSRGGEKQITRSRNKGTPVDIPAAVLINGGSASASEILAAVFKESLGAPLIGEKTFGKGTVQGTFEKAFGDGSNVKMTIMKWLTPNGRWIDRKGIEPDVPVEQPDYFKVAPFSRKLAKLEYDMTGDDVKTLQLMLSGLGFAPDRTDGYFSKETAAQVKAYQKSRQLPATGIVDEETMRKLEHDMVLLFQDPAHDKQLQTAVSVLQDLLNKK